MTVSREHQISTFKTKLKHFIAHCESKELGMGNIWLKFGTMNVYFRLSKRLIFRDQKGYLLCLDISNVASPMKDRNKGYFRELLKVIREITDLPLFVENAFPEFSEALQGPKYNFRLVSTDALGSCLIRDEKAVDDYRVRAIVER